MMVFSVPSVAFIIGRRLSHSGALDSTPVCVAALTDQENQAMSDKFDPYRESLVVESTTQWPADLTEIDGPERQRIAEALHADPENASHLQYVRTHTGFCRQITVTQEDIERLS